MICKDEQKYARKSTGKSLEFWASVQTRKQSNVDAFESRPNIKTLIGGDGEGTSVE